MKAFFANVAQNLPSERPDPQRQGGHQQQALLISRGRSTAKSATTGGESSSAAGAAAHNLYPQGGERAHQQETLERPISNHRGGERAHEQEALQRNISNHRGARAQQQAAQKLSTSAPRSATTGGQMRFRRGTSYPTWGGGGNGTWDIYAPGFRVGGPPPGCVSTFRAFVPRCGPRL